MSLDRPVKAANVVEVPGPSLSSEGRIRIVIEKAQAAVLGLQGAADAIRSLGR